MDEQQEKREMRRMLEQFKANLPPHDLGDWKLHAQPLPPPIEVEGGPLYPMTVGPEWTRFRIEGWATCTRCGLRYAVPNSGDAVTISEERIESTAEDIKGRMRRKAERDGPCWGDVPDVQDDSLHFAVMNMDSA